MLLAEQSLALVRSLLVLLIPFLRIIVPLLRVVSIVLVIKRNIVVGTPTLRLDIASNRLKRNDAVFISIVIFGHVTRDVHLCQWFGLSCLLDLTLCHLISHLKLFHDELLQLLLHVLL
jgi:hypothetical protein